MPRKIRPCIIDGCNINHPSYNLPGSKYGIVCKPHVLLVENGHLFVNVVNHLCEYPGANCQITGTKKANCSQYPGLYCADHSKLIAAELNILVLNPSLRYCQEINCGKLASFGYNGDEEYSFCSDHKEPDMINLRTDKCPTCKLIGVDRCAYFGFKGKPERFCCEHKIPGMINLGTKKCITFGCKTMAGFGPEGGSSICCKKCIPPGTNYINLSKATCLNPNCSREPSFNFFGLTAKYCSYHKEPGMIDVKHRKCEKCLELYHAGLITATEIIHASFGKRGDTYRFCLDHKQGDMINLYCYTCESPGCGKQACFIDTQTGNKLCTTHKMDNAILIYIPQCSECTMIASYGYEGEKKTTCFNHKKPGMITSNKKMCEKCNLIIATYGWKNGKCQFCYSHFEEGMIDLSYKKCSVLDCVEKSLFGISGESETHCRFHKKSGMIIFPSCKCTDCDNPATYGIDGILPYHCINHYQGDEINLIEEKCGSCGLNDILNNNGLCNYCNPTTIKVARLVKQTKLMDYLNSRGLVGNSTDKIVDSGECTKRRPDRVYHCPDGSILILECDENQHRERSCECEQQRMVEISQNYGGSPVYFIRWNPDKYFSGTQYTVEEPVNKRHQLVGDFIEAILDGRCPLPKKALLSVIYMYFDGWTSLQDESWRGILFYHDESDEIKKLSNVMNDIKI